MSEHAAGCGWYQDWHQCDCGAFDRGWMSQTKVCTQLIEEGAKEYKDRTKHELVRCFALKSLESVPACSCNERPPSLHILTYPDYGGHPGGVEFQVVGEAGDKRWLSATIYSVKREEVIMLLPEISKVAAAVWKSFVSAMEHRRENADH